MAGYRKNWTNEQVEAVVAKAITFQNLAPFRAIERAMHELIPQDLWYTPSTIHSVNNWPTMLFRAAAIAGLVSKDSARYKRMFLTGVEEPKTSLPKFIGSVPQHQPEQPPQAPTLENATTEQLLTALAVRMRADLMAEMRHHVNHVIAAGVDAVGGYAVDQSPVPVRTVSADTPGQSCRRVAIVGLMPVQQVILQRSVKQSGVWAEVRFWTDTSMGQLHSLLKWADDTYVMTKFISHETYNVVKREARELHHCNGAVTDLARSLVMLVSPASITQQFTKEVSHVGH